MTDSADSRRSLAETRWVHVDGDDAEGGAVFRDSAGDLPLSRRPKEILEFGGDGTVRRLATGADDRAREVDRTKWRHEDGHVVFTFDAADAHGRRRYHVVEHGTDQIVVRRD